MVATIWFCLAVLFFVLFLYMAIGAPVPKQLKRRDPGEPAPLLQVCDCEHARCMHRNDGACNELVYRGSRWVECRCLKYMGPISALELITPPTIDASPPVTTGTVYWRPEDRVQG